MPLTKSLLRYPGGKSQLTKFIKHLLDINNIHETYIEPFAGGFGLALNLLFDGSVKNVVLNDFDPSIYSLWYNILNNVDELIYKINTTNISIEEWHHQRDIHLEVKDNPLSIDNAYSTLFLNRTNVSGIINGGPIGGINQQGKYKLDCRFKKKVLIDKATEINKRKDSIYLNNLNANEFINKKLINYDPNDTFIFYDPPYFKQGKNLYMSFVRNKDHQQLASNIISKNKYNWITTYDIQDEIYQLYSGKSQTYTYSLNYSANVKRKAKEYLFANYETKIESFHNVKLIKIK
ncbi:DNA adenine methylase [Lactobacillus kimbladii]|uniref:DNA adenine methylase n=1 Tax=Lactobacillus kimbladii TaxID=1218506 RepID=UPI00164FA6DD|nr:DNA adenine methylase [Lactobacillus kimbladii]MBC6343128.1 DNA adenine methylase [Lactobacillus kimbladii]